MKPRPLAISLALILATAFAGLALRLAPLGLPRFVSKYGGSILWALMIYWIVSTLLPLLHVTTAALAAGAIAAAVELIKLYRSPGMDAFRQTLPGMLLLGRYFSVKGYRRILDRNRCRRADRYQASQANLDESHLLGLAQCLRRPS